MESSLDTSAECFVDPHEEIFIGPISEKEREIRKNLPRRTLHPSEVAELKQRGMSYREWEDYKEQCNNKAIHQVYGGEHESSSDSFSSCCDSDDEAIKSDNDSLNDTWEIQERMLAMAERLERGEDIPELGICHERKDDSVDMDGIFPLEETKNSEVSKADSFTKVENEIEEQKDDILASQTLLLCTDQISSTADDKKMKTLHSPIQHSEGSEAVKAPVVEIFPLETDQNLIDFNSVVEAGNSSKASSNRLETLQTNTSVTDKLLMKTPSRTPKSGLTSTVPSSDESGRFKTPSRTPLSASSTKKRTPLTAGALRKPTPSPVGMYIRGGPEPLLIENVRSTQKKLLYTNPAITRQKIAVKNAQGRWSIDTRRSSTTTLHDSSKENVSEIDPNIKPVLPVVLHEAAASVVTENANKETVAMPWSRGKIGKLLERNPSPTILKHQGRIQVNKSDITQATKIPHFGVTLKSDSKSDHRDSSLMDVSVLQEVLSGIQQPNKQKSAIPVRRFNNLSK